MYIFNFKIQCMDQTWYLDNDMQMFLVAPLVIYPLWKFKTWGVFFSCKSILSLSIKICLNIRGNVLKLFTECLPVASFLA